MPPRSVNRRPAVPRTRGTPRQQVRRTAGQIPAPSITPPSSTAVRGWNRRSSDGTAGVSGVEISKLLSTLGVVTLDRGFANTGSTTSAVTYIDGEAGILRYRGYPIERLAESSTFLETSYLLINGELPSAGRSSTRSPVGSAGTPCCTRTSSTSSTASPATPIRCPCCPARSARCPRSTGTPLTRSTPSRWSCRRYGCWRSCRRSPPMRTGNPSGNPCCTRTTPSATSRTSCGCPSPARPNRTR